MAVFTFSRVPAFNPNTTPVSVARSASGSVYDIGDTGFTTPLNLTLVATNTVTTTLVSDANGMFPDFTLVDRTQCVFKSGSAKMVLTTTTPIPGPPGAASTVPGPPGPATTDASMLQAGTLDDERLPARLQAEALNTTIGAKTGVTADDPAHTTKLIPGTGRNGLFIRSEQATYGLKVDQYDNNGVHDTVNIAANFAGAHTPFSVNSGNTTLSTVKIVNTAVQTGGAVVAAVASNAGRTAELFGADNSGTGPSYLSTMKGGNGIAFRAAYDAGAYTNSIMWGTGHHTGGNLFFIENDGAHTSGSMLRLSETNAASNVSIVSIANSGTGESITAPSFNVLKDGRTKLKQIENLSSFNNGQVKMTDAGIVADRNIADASPVVKIQNVHASSTGDILQIVKTGGEVVSRFTKDGGFVTKRNAAIADADLKLGEMMIWFDASAGAFKVKAKDSAGVIKTGTVALA